MKNQRIRSSQLLTSLSLGLAALLIPTAASAQKTVEPAADEAVWGSSSSSSSGDASDLMKILQQGQVGPTQSQAEFLEKQEEEIDEATEAYRNQQRGNFSVFPRRRPSANSSLPPISPSESSVKPGADSVTPGAATPGAEASAMESADGISSNGSSRIGPSGNSASEQAPRPALW